MTPGRRARVPSRAREGGARYASAPTGPVVVDASIAFLWFANEPNRERADRLLETSVPLFAPDLMAVEVTNAWWKRSRRGEMDAADVEQAVTLLFGLPIVWKPSAPLLRPAVRLATALGHPVYDCVYLALADEHAASIATVDERLRRAAERVDIRTW